MKQVSICLILLWALHLSIYPVGTPNGDSNQTLQHYINTAMSNNLALQRETLSLQKSLLALKEARGMFLPSISIEARYSRAGGGRAIEIPIGDLMNPVHHSLNQLLSAHGQVPAFPGNLPNESIPFLRKREHETKIRLTQPLFQPGIFFNAKIKKQLSKAETAKVAAFKRQLETDIKTAYYTYLKTLRVKELLMDTKTLLKENVRISKSLFKNHKRTEDTVFRSEAELGKVEAQLAEAEKNRQTASAYFNFLLNRQLNAPIDTEPQPEIKWPVNSSTPSEKRLQQLETSALKKREEFEQLFRAQNAAQNAVKLHKSSILPSITAVVDYGFQGERYKFTGKDDYWMASIVMSWNLYKGGRDNAKKKQAILALKQLQLQHMELQNKIRLQVKEAFYNLLAAQSQAKSYQQNEKSRKEAFHIVSKKYNEGMVPQIEYIKAQNDLTQASLQRIIAGFDVHIKIAQLERATGGGIFY